MPHAAIVRVEVRERGRPALPPVDVATPLTIGSGDGARIRLPAASGWRAEHVRVADGRWWMGAASGELPLELEHGAYAVRVAAAPADAVAAPPQRTASLARELLRSLLGDGAAPSLVVERGPIAGATRALAPPESALVIGRGDEAGWIVDDADLSRAHAELRRGWDGVRVIDLGSKNGTRVDGARVGAGGTELHDGALVELGRLALRFRDPAEQHLLGATPVPAASAPAPIAAAPRRASAWPFYAAAAIAVLALAALAWLLL